jgi:hypothetical protein
MTSRHCATCNAIESVEHSLKTCGRCKRVAYCDHDCQKLHWVVHKAACRAAVAQDQKPDNHKREPEREDTRTQTDFQHENGNRVRGGITYPAGTYIDWFEMPTTKKPDGSSNIIHFTKSMAVWVAGLSDDEAEVFEAQIVEGCKSGFTAVEIFQQVAEEKGLTRADQELANKPGAYEKALPILAARYNASRAKEVHISKRDGSKFVRRNDQGDVVLLDANNEEFVASDDAVYVLKFADDEERTEVVFFDSDDIANMKHLRGDEKQMYRNMFARVTVEQRHPGLTVTRVGDIQVAAETETGAEQKASKGDMDIN